MSDIKSVFKRGNRVWIDGREVGRECDGNGHDMLSIARIEDGLRGLGAEHEPPPGWEARVLAGSGTVSTRPPWWARSSTVLALEVFTIAAFVVAALLLAR